MILSAILLGAVQPALPPVKVADVVAAAGHCIEAVATKKVNTAYLKSVGWVEVEPADGKYFRRREGTSSRVVAMDNVCSLVAPVASFDDVQAVLSGVDDLVDPGSFKEVEKGILLTKGARKILFYVGSPTVESAPAVRIDVMNSESDR